MTEKSVNRGLRYLPNILTALRMIAAPATVVLLLAQHYRWVLVIFVLAGLSDAADGFLARRYNLVTRFGRYLDPAADKALMLCVFATLAILGQRCTLLPLIAVPIWLAALVIGRDCYIVFGVALLWLFGKRIIIAPLTIGKLCTALQVVYISLHLAAIALGFSLRAIVPFDAYVLAAVTLASAIAYSDVGIRLFLAKVRA